MTGPLPPRTPTPLVFEAKAGGPRRITRDLGIRTLSASVLLAVALAALWAGGSAFGALVALVAAGVLVEYWGLVRRITARKRIRTAWMAFGFAYVGAAAAALLVTRENDLMAVMLIFAITWGTDVGAYMAGRAIGGPRLAPRLSPSKTWSGLAGGMALAALAAMLVAHQADMPWSSPFMPQVALAGALLAVVAQAGDLFESWMKRRAGVKDSGRLIPGHGGLFDRVDGLIPVAIVGVGVLWLYLVMVG